MQRPLGVYICHECGQGLPAWQQAILSVVAVALAFGLLYGLTRLRLVRGRWRDMQLRTCFLAIQLAWASADPNRLGPFVTPELGDRLRRQLEEMAAGQVGHHGRPRVRKLRVLSGGGKRDGECVARIRSSGGRRVGGDDALWRFVRDPERGWIAAEIGAEAPG